MAIGVSKLDSCSSRLISKLPIICAFGFVLANPAVTNAASSGRQIEEVVVTAERQKSSVQDTSISITAFTGDMLEEFGIRDQSDLQNFIPATVILPYDAAIRGVGRNFRNLGGDPGISTYMNGVYSEDLFTATVGSFWDMERIEILRGPQGTLYGRNAVGGAMNFIYNRPSQEFDYKFKAMAGNFDAVEFYGMINGALIEDQLSARFAFSNRDRDGIIQERGTGPDLDSKGEENYSLQLNWTPLDNLEFNVRTNIARVYRVMGGADGGGLIVLRGESIDGESRDFSNTHHGFRAVDPLQTNPLASDYVNPAQQVTSFTNPTTGVQTSAQKVRSGIDENDSILVNNGFGSGNSDTRCVITDKNDIDRDDVCAFTNGFNVEDFEQHGIQFEANWDVNDNLSFKYIYGFNDLSYERVTDDDSTFNTLSDRQFYVNHEAQYESHELQAFYNINDRLSFTSGIFFYDATIDQRGDFFDGNANTAGGSKNGQFVTGATDPIGANISELFDFVVPGLIEPQVLGLYSAKARQIEANGKSDTGDEASLILGVLHPDAGGPLLNVKHGPDTVGSDLLYGTRTRRDSFATYTQGVWDIDDKFTLTFGLRWAEDKVAGEENLYRATTLCAIDICGLTGLFGGTFLGLPNLIDPSSKFFDPEVTTVNNLASYNVFLGTLDPVNLQPTGNGQVLNSIPIALSIHRSFDRTDDKLTGRINLDWNINDSSMMYFSVTTGYRGGGFNLLFFSETSTFGPEELISYEIGYKAQLLNNTLQLNSSVYFYDYDTIHTFGTEVSLTGGTTSSVLEAPGAELIGFEIEGMWLATDRITIGGNYSFTHSEYTESLLIKDDGDIRFPASIIPANDSNLDIDGNQLLNVPENKATLWASYEQPLGGAGKVNFMVTASWIDEVFFSPFETEFDRAPEYLRVDFRTTWKSPQENWVVTAFVSNIFDEIGIRQIEASGEEEGFRRTAQLTEPRIIGFELSYSLR